MFIAREKELKKLDLLLKRKKSSFLAIYGRRRVGKTEIVRYFCEKNTLIKVEFSGRVEQNRTQQIKAFVSKLKRVYGVQSQEKISDWNDAFYLLTDYIKTLNQKEKIVVFIDELPWIDTAKSGFLGELADFWNDFCSQRDNIILVVCGSSASYMLKKVINNRGALHGRLTDIMPMQQFDLNATKQMLEVQGCRYANKSVVDTYMVLGGVAKYLESLDCSLTPTEAIDSLCFQKDALLKYEYEVLFSSLFNDSKTHYAIMDVLSSKWTGYTQKELSALVKVSTSYMKKPLEELVASGFISEMKKFNQKKRDVLYRATDCFSYFHSKWMNGSSRDWRKIVTTQSYRVWAGFAFESICHMHSEHIKKILGISGVETETHYWNYVAQSSKEKGSQIDMMLEHTNGSNNIDIIECKYHNGAFSISKAYRDELMKKIEIFNEQTKFKYNIRLIFITSFGMVRNEYYNEIVSKDISLDEVIEVRL